jgi:hypothetical protein
MMFNAVGNLALAVRGRGGARKALLAFGASSILALATLGVAAAPAGAYGKANYQVTFAGTAVLPGTGNGFGFWGWCDLAGSGSTGDCQIAQYQHSPAGSGFTCHESLDLTGWTAVGTIVISGTATVTPGAQTASCLSFFPGSSPFSGVNTGFPSAPGHYNIGVDALLPGAAGEFNVTVTQVP